MDLYNRARAQPSLADLESGAAIDPPSAGDAKKLSFFSSHEGSITFLNGVSSENSAASYRPLLSRHFTLAFVVVTLLWFALLFYGELGVFHASVARCRRAEVEGQRSMLLVADPQLTNFYSYSTNFWIFETLLEYYSDIYMRRYFQAFQQRIKLDAVAFLGDLFDGVTNYMHLDFDRATFSPKEYSVLMKRWNWVFPLKDHRADSDAALEVFNVAGNHDIGFNIPEAQQVQLAKTFVDNFGPLNYKRTFAGHDIFVVANTVMNPAVSSPSLFNETNSFLESAKATLKSNPRILFTHVPLLRPQSASCGVENPEFHMHVGGGYSYTNMLSKPDTDRLLDIVRPDYVFTGDQHSLCHYRRDGPIEDYVLSTFSWLQGQLYPGAAVLYFYPKEGGRSYQLEVASCDMHNQLQIYIAYGIAAVLTLVVALVAPLRFLVHDAPRRRSLVELFKERLISFGLLLFPIFAFYSILHFTLM